MGELNRVAFVHVWNTVSRDCGSGSIKVAFLAPLGCAVRLVGRRLRDDRSTFVSHKLCGGGLFIFDRLIPTTTNMELGFNTTANATTTTAADATKTLSIPPNSPIYQQTQQEKAMHALSDQLIDLKMDDAVPMENLVVEEGDGDGPNAPSPSESDAAAAAAPKSGGSRSQLKAQKHQVIHEGREPPSKR